MTILFPLVLSLSAYYVLNKTKVFSGLNVLEKLVLVLASSVSTINILLVYLGQISPIGLKPFAISIFLICLFFILLSFKFIANDVLSIFKSIYKNKTYKLLFILLLVLVTKVTLFYILRPIVDPDIVSQYLTYARSIAISNRIPSLDMFTLNPVTTPPIGGPMLFGFYYLVTGNLQSEGFRLLTYPFFLGLLALTYLISKKLFGSTWFALLSSVVFLSFPLIDSLLLEWALYPDIITTFLEMVIIYFLFFKNSSSDSRGSFVLDVVLGLSAAEMLLLKSQSILLFVVLAILILLRAKILKYNTYLLGCILAIAVLFFPLFNLFGLHLFRLGKIEMVSYLLLTIPVMIILFFGFKDKEPVKKIRFASTMIIGAIATTGVFWLVRNYFLFKNFLSAYNVGIYKGMSLQYQIFIEGVGSGVTTDNLQSFNTIALVALPVFGSFFFIPKIVGIITSLFNRHWNMVVFFIMFWYALVVIYSGYPNERYLLGIFPFLSALVVQGIRYVINKVFPNTFETRKNLFNLVAVVLFALFSLLQSIILSWGFGSSFFSPSELRKIAFSSNQEAPKFIELSINNNGFKAILVDKLISVAELLNIRLGTFSNADIAPSIMSSVSISLIVLVCAFILIKLTSLNKLKKYLILAIILIITPYLILILQISGGNVNSFSKGVEHKLYNYWGEANTIVPYFKNHHDESSIILVVGPQTGLSYKIFMKAYNIEYGYGFIEILPVAKEENELSIYKYFKDRNIQYVLVYEGKDNGNYLKNFESNSTIYNFIKNPDFFTVEIFPDGDNLWRLYKLKAET